MTPTQISASLKEFYPSLVIQWVRGKTLPEIYHSKEGLWLYEILQYIPASNKLCVQLIIDLARLAFPSSGRLKLVSIAAIKSAENWLAEPSLKNAKRCHTAANTCYKKAVFGREDSAAAFTAAYAAYAASPGATPFSDKTSANYANSAATWAWRAGLSNITISELFQARISEDEFIRLFTEASTTTNNPHQHDEFQRIHGEKLRKPSCSHV